MNAYVAPVGHGVSADVSASVHDVTVRIWPPANRLRMTPAEARSFAHRLILAADGAEGTVYA